MERELSGLELCAIFIDGIEFKKQMLVVALGLDKKGKKHILGYGKGPQRTPLSVPIREAWT